MLNLDGCSLLWDWKNAAKVGQWERNQRHFSVPQDEVQRFGTFLWAFPFIREEGRRDSPPKILKPALELQPLVQFSSRMHQWTLLSYSLIMFIRTLLEKNLGCRHMTGTVPVPNTSAKSMEMLQWYSRSKCRKKSKKCLWWASCLFLWKSTGCRIVLGCMLHVKQGVHLQLHLTIGTLWLTSWRYCRAV